MVLTETGAVQTPNKVALLPKTWVKRSAPLVVEINISFIKKSLSSSLPPSELILDRIPSDENAVSSGGIR